MNVPVWTVITILWEKLFDSVRYLCKCYLIKLTIHTVWTKSQLWFSGYYSTPTNAAVCLFIFFLFFHCFQIIIWYKLYSFNYLVLFISAFNKTMERLHRHGKSLKNFTYTDKDIADDIYSAINSTQFLGVSVSN